MEVDKELEGDRREVDAHRWPYVQKCRGCGGTGNVGRGLEGHLECEACMGFGYELIRHVESRPEGAKEMRDHTGELWGYLKEGE